MIPLIPLAIELDGDGCWPDLDAVIDAGKYHEGRLEAVALLKNGTESGKHTVTFRVDMPDGSVVVAQTTLALLVMATRGMKARAEVQGQTFE